MQTHPVLIEKSVDATLRAYARGRLTYEEAELDLTELIASQMSGRTHYAIAVVGFYVRTLLKAYSRQRIELPDAFDALVDAVAEAPHGHAQVSRRLARCLPDLRQ